ncbi:MAG TPA: hypothetical protein PK788_11065 [Gemmatimonadaceae bacterium]|nr:hypothetical protein [Gemmatimonadaceae bacterium]HRQ78186.1 hypothetical protein [Gemmatimonadaceae bacterium]
MPDNAIYYQMAYGAIVALFAGYALSIQLRRKAIARKRAELERQR